MSCAATRIRQAGLDPWVEFHQADTHGDCWQDWADPVQFIFIDASHDHASARADFGVWLLRMATGAMVLCHNVTMEPEVLLRDGVLSGVQDDGYLGSTMAFGEALKAASPTMMGRCMMIGWSVVG